MGTETCRVPWGTWLASPGWIPLEFIGTEGRTNTFLGFKLEFISLGSYAKFKMTDLGYFSDWRRGKNTYPSGRGEKGVKKEEARFRQVHFFRGI